MRHKRRGLRAESRRTRSGTPSAPRGRRGHCLCHFYSSMRIKCSTRGGEALRMPTRCPTAAWLEPGKGSLCFTALRFDRSIELRWHLRRGYPAAETPERACPSPCLHIPFTVAHTVHTPCCLSRPCCHVQCVLWGEMLLPHHPRHCRLPPAAAVQPLSVLGAAGMPTSGRSGKRLRQLPQLLGLPRWWLRAAALLESHPA